MMPEVLPVTRIEFELTEQCNLHCRFCYNSCQPVTCEHPEAILNALHLAGALEIILTGGEPSMHPRFFEILAAAASLFPRVMVQSNGVAFEDEVSFERLSRHPIFCLNFSLHGPELIHDALTGVAGSFRKTTRALAKGAKACIRTASNLVLTSINSDPSVLKETVEVLYEAGVSEMTLTRFIPCGTGQSARSLATSPEAFFRAIDVLRKATSARGISLLLANAIPRCRLPEHQQDLCNRCSFGFDKFYVNARGTLMTCGMARVPLGNLLDAPLRDILSVSEVYRDYQELRHIPEHCRHCPDLPDCGGGCRAAALTHHGQITAEDPFCFNVESVN